MPATKAGVDAPPAPFSQVFVTITKQEHIELRTAATQWQGLHRKAVIVTAPSPARLINRGKFGISVWTSVLLDKFAYGWRDGCFRWSMCD